MKPSTSKNHEPHRATYLRLSITDECDMRCTYCTPHRQAVEHVGEPLTAREIAILVDGFARNGVTKVRLTGGEPLLRPDVVEIAKSVVRIPGIETVGLTTNGIRLEQIAPELARAGLQKINISLDTLNPTTFRRLTGQDGLDKVLKGIDAALRCGFEKIRINTVVMRGINDSELPTIAELAQRLPVEVRFIELMPLDHSTDEWQATHIPAAEIRQILGGLKPRPMLDSSSARLYDLPGMKGTVGIISPMSEPFCSVCNRIRITSRGKLKPCLRLPIEEDIRPLLSEPDFVEQLGVIIERLSCHKLPEILSTTSAVRAKTMRSIGG